MTHHLVITESDTTPDEITTALDAVGIEAQAKAIHLQRTAQLVAAVVAEYPLSERAHARETVMRWIDEYMEAGA